MTSANRDSTEPDIVVLVPVALPSDGDEAQSVDGACLALRAVSDYATMTGVSKTAPVRELVVNLVADLMHLASQSGFSFESVVVEAAEIVRHDFSADNTPAVNLT
jgi:hypothetical protein